VCVLDGGEMRRTISRDLGYSSADRSENLRRAIEVARIVNEAGGICICAFMAPSGAVREKAKAAVGAERFVEIYLSAAEETRTARDPRGALDRSESAEALDYEVPAAPDAVLATDQLSVEDSVTRIVAVLNARGLLA
jgi:bifunctional enzyme CysN/CysC